MPKLGFFGSLMPTDVQVMKEMRSCLDGAGSGVERISNALVYALKTVLDEEIQSAESPASSRMGGRAKKSRGGSRRKKKSR